MNRKSDWNRTGTALEPRDWKRSRWLWLWSLLPHSITFLFWRFSFLSLFLSLSLRVFFLLLLLLFLILLLFIIINSLLGQFSFPVYSGPRPSFSDLKSTRLIFHLGRFLVTSCSVYWPFFGAFLALGCWLSKIRASSIHSSVRPSRDSFEEASGCSAVPEESTHRPMSAINS